jgi:hypothetical protein
MGEINIDSVSRKFENHLKIDGNHRVIFSGKFGIGKTFFLNRFFDSRETDYNKIIISPVNYVVNSNEDIFELIKADIIQHLFFSEKTGIPYKKEASKIQDLMLFAYDKPQHFLKFITSSLKKVNPLFEIGDNFYDALKNLYSEFKKYEEQIAKNLKLDEEKLSDFFNSFLDTKGTLFENDFITQTLTSVLNGLKDEGKKKNVLIIDDFDRIDPEHIFRILNILSVHNNYYGTENKFAFDHVIIVCDIENIKKIFSYKYGNDVDFDGYLDKFYSTDIFFYSNNDSLKFYITENFRVGSNNQSNMDFVEFVLQNLVDINSLSIRKLLKHRYDIFFEKFTLKESSKSEFGSFFYLQSPSFIKNYKTLYTDSDDLSILRFFKLMTFVFGDFNSFYKNLIVLKKNHRIVDYYNSENLILFLATQFHIAIQKEDNLFFSRQTDSVRGHILSLDYPTVNMLDNDFRINLEWTYNNPYVSEESYFKNAKASIIRQVTIYNNQESGITFKFSSIFEVIEKIIIACASNGYLSNAGIIFNTDKLNR